jgi:topoisomerase IV subunit A
LRENTEQLLVLLRRELELRNTGSRKISTSGPSNGSSSRNGSTSALRSAAPRKPSRTRCAPGSIRFRSQLKRDVTDADLDRLLAVRIRRISLFDIEQHRNETEQVKAELAEVRGHLKRLVPYAIRLLEGLLEKYDGQFPRRTRSSRHDEIDAREVAFKAFKVAYDRETGYLGHKVNGDEFKTDCTKFDKLLLLHRDGHYRLVDLPERLFVGSDLVHCGLPERDRVVTLVYADRDAAYLKRFTFGGMILNREYHCTLPKSKILFFALDTPEKLYFRYKPAPYQRINQQTCQPARVEVRGPKTRGRQVSIKEVVAVGARPPRGWDPEAPTTAARSALR